MKFGGLGIPELLIMFVVLAVPITIIIIIVKVVRKNNKSFDQTAAYQRMVQLDDLHNRGMISDAEYEYRKQEASKDL